MFQYVNVINVVHNTLTIKVIKYFALLTPFCDSLKVNEKLHFRYILIFFVCYFSILIAFVLKHRFARVIVRQPMLHGEK